MWVIENDIYIFASNDVYAQVILTVRDQFGDMCTFGKTKQICPSMQSSVSLYIHLPAFLFISPSICLSISARDNSKNIAYVTRLVMANGIN